MRPYLWFPDLGGGGEFLDPLWSWMGKKGAWSQWRFRNHMQHATHWCSFSPLQPFPAAALNWCRPSPLQPFLHRCSPSPLLLVGKSSLCFCEGWNLSKIYSFASLLRTHVCSLASYCFSEYVVAKEYQKGFHREEMQTIITLWKKLLVWIQVDPDVLPMSLGVHPWLLPLQNMRTRV